MTAPQRSLHSLPDTRIASSSSGAQKSRSNVFSLELADTPLFREWFARTFAGYLRENFRSPEHVAVTFGKRYQTALNWWNAENMASGEAVGVVFMSFPQAQAFFLAAWEDRE